MSAKFKGTILTLFLMFCLSMHWCQRIGCMTESKKPPPAVMSSTARSQFLNKLGDLKTDKASFIQEGRARNQILLYELMPHIRINVRRKPDRQESRYFYITHDEDRVILNIEDFSPTGSVELICTTQTDIITEATTHIINDGPLKGDFLLTRWTKSDTKPRTKYGYSEVFNLSYLDGAFGYMFESGIVYDCLKKNGMLDNKASSVQKQPKH